MKNTLLALIFIYSLFSHIHAQDEFVSYSKDDLIATWRVCNVLDFEQDVDTIVFQQASPGCNENDCGEHQWSFRSSGSVEFVFTKGCDSGFNSISRNPKRWFFIEKDNIIKLVSNDGFRDVYFIQELSESSLVLIRKRNLE